jgi:DNA-binding transcriptional LysR family regulator
MRSKYGTLEFMRTEDLEAFFAIVEDGGISAAASRLQVPKSTISRRLARLEDELDTQLILRTPRSSQVTELGEALHRRGAPAMALLEEISLDLRERGAEPRGKLRVSAPTDLAAFHLGVLCADFRAHYPKVQMELLATNSLVDLIAQGIDVALRVHREALPDASSLRIRTLCPMEVGLYAAPSYVEAHGQPRRLDALARHDLLCMMLPGRHLTFSHPRKTDPVEIAVPSLFRGSPRRFSPRARTRPSGVDHGCGQTKRRMASRPPHLPAHQVLRPSRGRVLQTAALEEVTPALQSP